MILLSLIIPIYNVEWYLDECLNSLKILIDRSDVEIIAVNDGSTDCSLTILEKWNKGYHNIRIISQQNRGLSAARNIGLCSSNGEYVSFLDSDDYIDASKLLELLTIADSASADITIGDFIEFKDENDRMHTKLNSIQAQPMISYDGDNFLNQFSVPLMSVVWRSLYKRSFLIDNNLSFHEGICFEDVEFTPLAFSKAKSVIYSGIPFYYYRKRGGSITTTSGSERKVNDALSVWRVLDKEASKEENVNIAPIMRELGFHCFLNQYSILDKCLSKDKLAIAKSLSSNEMKSHKYTACSLLFRLLPDNAFHKILKKIR